MSTCTTTYFTCSSIELGSVVAQYRTNCWPAFEKKVAFRSLLQTKTSLERVEHNNMKETHSMLKIENTFFIISRDSILHVSVLDYYMFFSSLAGLDPLYSFVRIRSFLSSHCNNLECMPGMTMRAISYKRRKARILSSSSPSIAAW